MKITKKQLSKIIKEEIGRFLETNEEPELGREGPTEEQLFSATIDDGAGNPEHITADSAWDLLMQIETRREAFPEQYPEHFKVHRNQ